MSIVNDILIGLVAVLSIVCIFVSSSIRSSLYGAIVVATMLYFFLMEQFFLGLGLLVFVALSFLMGRPLIKLGESLSDSFKRNYNILYCFLACSVLVMTAYTQRIDQLSDLPESKTIESLLILLLVYFLLPRKKYE